MSQTVNLSIKAEGGHLCSERGYRFSPGDVVRGRVYLQNSAPIDLTTVSVTFLGEHSGSNGRKTQAHERPKTSLFNEETELYRRDRWGGETLLAAGDHSWPFEFRFPELPYDGDTQKYQSTYPPTFTYLSSDRDAVAYVKYAVVAELKGAQISHEASQNLVFWPARHTVLKYDQPFQAGPRTSLRYYKIQRSAIGQRKKRFVLFGRTARVGLLAVLYAPAVHIIGQKLPLQLDLRIVKPAKSRHGDKLPQCYITDISVQLFSSTRVGEEVQLATPARTASLYKSDGAALRVDVPVAKVDAAVDLSTRINLHDVLPSGTFVIPTQPWKGLNVEQISNRRGTYPITDGPIVPSFSSALCERTYLIVADVTVESAGISKSFVIKSGEIILLPDRYAGDVNEVFQKLELAPSHQGGRYEAPDTGLSEAGGTVSEGRIDLKEVNPVELPSPTIYSELEAAPVMPPRITDIRLEDGGKPGDDGKPRNDDKPRDEGKPLDDGKPLEENKSRDVDQLRDETKTRDDDQLQDETKTRDDGLNEKETTISTS